ncbi:hypothetical protein [Actinokineospora diospyrosa]|uniref:DUF4259 domain-containing protein n=1 Tax=Actinokineospora diospyrosa TaxID=103728 RepID=A0ABT1I5K1_9PSEU|nr:hypothetical protein [Actinokineospora diospyrosa]MCP2267910.1 hypothetical protein [Actinokineospora diospyrosa]
MAADVSAQLVTRGPTEVAAFVAGCAERVAQLFTGLRGDDPERADDVDTYLRGLDLLWDVSAPSTEFDEVAAAMARWPELDTEQEPLVEDDDIDSFYAVLALWHAVSYRTGGDVAEAQACAHAVWTAMGLLDENLPDSALAEAELEQQRQALANTVSPPELLRRRAEDQRVSRERLLVAHGS